MNKPTERVSNNANQQQPQQAQCFESDVTDTRLQYGLKTESPPPLHVDRQSNRFSNDVSGTINYQQPFTSSHSHFSQSPSFSNNLNNPPPQINSSNFYSNRPYLSPERGIGGIERSPPPPPTLPLFNNSNNIPPSNTTSLPYTTHSTKKNSTHEYPTNQSNNASYMHHASSNLLPQPNNNPYSNSSSNYSNPDPRNQTLLPSINQVVNRNIPGTAHSFTQGQEQHYLIPPSTSIGNIPIRNGATTFPTNNDRDNTSTPIIELSNTNNNNGSVESGIMSGNGSTILSNNAPQPSSSELHHDQNWSTNNNNYYYHRTIPTQQQLHDHHAFETTMPPQPPQQQQQYQQPYSNNMHVGYQQQHHGDGSVSSSSANDPQIFQTTQQEPQQYYPSIPSIPSIQQVHPSHQFHQQQQIRTVNTTTTSSTSGSGSTSTPNTPVQSGNSTAVVVMNERKIPQPSSQYSNQYSNHPQQPHQISSTTIAQNPSSSSAVQKQHESLYHDFYVPIKKKTNEGKNTNPLSMNNNLNHNNTSSTNNLLKGTISNSQLVSDTVVVGGSIVPLCSLCDRKITKRYWVRDCNVGVMRSFSKNEAIVGNSCCKACYTKARKIIKSQKPTLSTINENICGSTNSQICTLDDSSTLINSNNNNNTTTTTTTTSSSVSSSVTESETSSTPDGSQIGNAINSSSSSLTHSETPMMQIDQEQHQFLTRDVLEELGQVLSGKLPMMTNNYSSQKIGKNKKKYDLHVDKIEEENEIVFNIKLKVNKK